jgi:hypothetical protein
MLNSSVSRIFTKGEINNLWLISMKESASSAEARQASLAAMYLEKKGYKNYVIYEKDNRVGGKCYSPRVKMGKDGKEERTVEMGAIMGAKTYYAVHEAEVFGGTSHADGPEMCRIYRDSNGKQIYPFDIEEGFLVQETFGLIKLKKAVKRLANLMATKYVGYDVNGHRGVAEGRYDGLDKTLETT